MSSSKSKTNKDADTEREESGLSNASASSTGPSPSNVSALHQLLAPDGYYTYLNIPIPVHKVGSSSSAVSEIDSELVKKNYRRLSLKHHPDRKGGDTETFRVLARAKKVLTTEKLRKQYDLLGLDLDDDEEKHSPDEPDAGSSEDNGSDETSSSSSPDSVVGHLASVTLATILQIVVRTAMICAVSTLLTRSKYLTLPLIAFLLFVAVKLHSTPNITKREIAIPLLISIAVLTMHIARTASSYGTKLFAIGEAATITIFLHTSLPTEKHSKLSTLSFTLLGMLIAFFLQGRFWRYAVVFAIEAFLAIVAVLVFPIMEMILEEIMNDKLRKVGDKIRAWDRFQVEAGVVGQ